MKNYYKILNVEPNASKDEITRQYNLISVAERKQVHTDAYNTLTDDKKREEYDKKLLDSIQKKEQRQQTLKKNKVRIITGATTLAVLVGGICLISSCSKKQNNNKNLLTTVTPAPTSTVTPTVTPTSAPTITPGLTVTPTPTATVAPTVTPTPVPEVGMTVNDINEVATLIAAENALKGLDVNYNNLVTALAVVNVEELSNEALYDFFNEEDVALMMKEQSHPYIDTVATNGIINGSDEKKYVRISELAGNQTDRAILTVLEDQYLELAKSMKEGKLTNEDYQNIVNIITSFYYSETNMLNTGAKSDYDALSIGAKYLADKCIFPQFNMAFYLSEFMTDENERDLRRLQLYALDGGNYKSEIICYVAEKLEKEKQLVK